MLQYYIVLYCCENLVVGIVSTKVQTLVSHGRSSHGNRSEVVS